MCHGTGKREPELDRGAHVRLDGACGLPRPVGTVEQVGSASISTGDLTQDARCLVTRPPIRVEDIADVENG